MNKLTADDLASDICTPKTISRIEQCTSDGHQEVLVALLHKLKIANVLQKGNILFDNLFQYKKELTIREALSKNDFVTATEALKEIKNTLSSQDIYNHQYLIAREASIKHRQNLINNYEYSEQLINALSLTLNINNIITTDLFLSRSEINCLYNLSLLPLSRRERQIAINIMIYLANNEDSPYNHDYKIQEMAIIACGNCYFEIGDLKQAFYYFQKLLQTELANYRLHLVPFSLQKMQQCLISEANICNDSINKLQHRELIAKCITYFSSL